MDKFHLVTDIKQKTKLKVAVFKFASCDGCQLAIIDCGGKLLELVDLIDIVYFPEATSRIELSGNFDIAFVEGSISTDWQLDHLIEVRQRTKLLVTIGACASSGGLQALRNFANHDEFRQIVYAHPEYIESLETSTPVSDHVEVDFELRGCPISEEDLVELITSVIKNKKPMIRDESVCIECKRQHNVCVAVANGDFCLGPVTHGGCRALCPAFGRGCYGCFGDKEQANAASLAKSYAGTYDDIDIQRGLRFINSWQEPFKTVSKDYEQ